MVKALFATLFCIAFAATSHAQSDSATATPPRPASQAVTGGSDHDDLLWLLRNWHQEIVPGSAQSKLDTSPDGYIDANDLMLLQLSWTGVLSATVTPNETEFYSPTWTPTRSMTPNETDYYTPTWTPTRTPWPTDTQTPTRTPTPTPVDPELFVYSVHAEDGIEYLFPSDQRVSIIFVEGLTREEGEEFLAEYEDLAGFVSAWMVWPSNGKDDVKVGLTRSIPWPELKLLLDVWASDPRVAFISPVFPHPNFDSIITRKISVKFLQGVTQDQIDRLFREYNLNVVRGPLYGFYSVQAVSARNGLDVLELGNRLHEHLLTERAAASFQGGVFLYTPGDTYFSSQWHLDKIDAPEGWEVEKGDASIIIAVLDSGVDLGHPDLDDNLMQGYDFADDDSDPTDDLPNGIDNKGHGTLVAGLAAAEMDNDCDGQGQNCEGLVGVCPECTIMPIKISFSSTGAVVDAAVIANAVDYAVDHGASIIVLAVQVVDDREGLLKAAIQNARNNGRGGKGCVIVGAAGNNISLPVAYPARLEQVIAVGYTDQNDLSGQSSGGPELDVMAPSGLPALPCAGAEGTEGDLYTTDIRGTAGSNNDCDPDEEDLTNDLDYSRKAGGTSAACPQVAGLAGLILSLNPELTAGQVQSIIQQSAYRTGGYNGAYGWGRINVYSALSLAQSPVERFILKNSEGEPTVGFDEFGFLYLKGLLYQHYKEGPETFPTPDPEKDELIIRDSEGTVKMLIDVEAGDIHLERCIPFVTVGEPDPANKNFVLKRSQGNPVAWVEIEDVPGDPQLRGGRLYLKGDYYFGCKP